MTNRTKQTDAPELLAPAGSFEAFFAALDAGADAVYTGLKSFSARAKAKNFSLAELRKITHYAQGEGRKLYVTLNTLVKEKELPQLVETLAELEDIGVDALIIQDLAIMRLARSHFPGLELHASTQMTVHNAAGVKMLERMGFTRAVLARELSLAEINEIRRQTTLELEHFIHGALCFSFSGQCYFSSFLGGHSGNRGRCAQPCRRQHRHRQQQGYYFSTNDLSAIDLLPELQQAGIISLKIEGRMKSAEYVHNVVSAYREALDAPPAARKEAIRKGKQLLKASFGRQPTRGFLPGGQPNDIAIPSVKGATGRYLGEIERVRGGEISFKTNDPLSLGDRLRIQPRTDRAGTAFTVRELKQGQRKVKQVSSGHFVSVPSPFKNQFKPGDGVFKVSSSQAFTLSDAACKRRLSKVRPPAEAIKLRIEVTDAQLQITAQVGSSSDLHTFPIESYPATGQGLSEKILADVFSVTADEPFRLKKLSCGPLPAIVIPPKRLKEIRRQFYAELRQQRQQQKQPIRDAGLKAAREALLPATGPQPGKRRLSVQLQSLREQRILQDPQVDRILVPLSAQNMQTVSRIRKGKEQIIWDLPFILFDREWSDFRTAVRQLNQFGFRHFRLNNLGHFPLFDGLEDIELHSSFRLFSLNSQSLCAWRELGISEAELYIEDDRDNLREILQRDCDVKTALTVYASVPLITSRIAIKGVRSDAPVVSDRSDAYRVNQRQGLTWLRSETDFSFLANLNELEGFGCHNFIIDLSHLDPFSQRGRQVLDATRRGIDPPDISKFNYEMGME
ncbi:MAG: peptidase U32 [Desulfuromonas sp.]|nr:MAG: peptidase U32 [Desulfuromonas sp.]